VIFVPAGGGRIAGEAFWSMDPSAEIEKILIFALDGRPTREACSKADKKAKKGLETGERK